MRASFKFLATVVVMIGLWVLGEAGTGLARGHNLGSDSSLAAARADTIPRVVQANNQFAVDLYGQLTKEEAGKNLLFSPTSISMALAMTAAGAKGQTESEMTETLHLTDILPQAHAAYHEALARWNSDDDARGYTLRVANRLWGQKGNPFLDSYLTLTQQQYGAALGMVDYLRQTEAARREINAWIEEQTNQKIKDLLPAGAIDSSTELVLTNAIYFKGDWASRFMTSQTHNEDFMVTSMEKAKVPLMRQEESCPFAEEGSVQALRLPYKGHDLSMLILLPKSPDGLADLEKSLSARMIADVQSRLRSRKVDVYLPRFRIEASFSMTKALEGLGMKLPFTNDADFSGMDGRQGDHLTAVVHKAFMDVSEEGTEAAAATAVVKVRHMAGPAAPPAVFRADHPFVFAICDNRDGSILFLGRVTDPRG